MALRNILKVGSPELRKTCRKVNQITPRIITLLDDMNETLHIEKGAGLAAPQVGVLLRVVIVDISGKTYELINPEIINASGEQKCEEGCLSIPDKWGYVMRPEQVVVKALDRNGVMQKYETKGIDVRVFCHEIDHLDGILFTDKMVEEIIDDE